MRLDEPNGKYSGIRAIKGESGDASPRFSHWPVMKSNVSYVFVRRGPSFGFLSFSRRTRFRFLGITRKCIYTYFKVDIILDIEVYLRDERNFILNEAISLD